VLVMFILLFLLAEGRMLSRRVVEVFGPSPAVQAKAAATLTEMARAVRTFLVWRTLVNLLLGVVVGVVYRFIFNLHESWTWALLTVIACYVPYLGPIFAGIPPVLDSFVSSPSPWYAVGLIVFYVGIINLEGYILVPVVMGRSMELNATTVMLACLFWDLVWGMPGLFLAMPLMAAIKAICAHVPGWNAWANLMSTEKGGLALERPKRVEVDDELEETQILSAGEAEELASKRRELLRKQE
jgi:predicted PurR-regulated permease PerM